MSDGGLRFGKYTVLRRIGAGGMAEIFKCRLTGIGGFDKTVVVKRILPDLLDDAEFVRMFLDEARIAANLSHPNIVQIYEIDQIDGLPYIAMEYVRGPTLARLIKESEKQGKPCEHVVARVMSDVASALHCAHNAHDAQGNPLNIIHRDVSPHNIIVSTEGVAKLVDFGVAKARGRLSKTNAGTVKGKIRYMAPEQFQGKSAPIDHRVDIFSAGVCLYQAATGKMPYNGDSEIEVLKQAATGNFLLPSDVKPDVDPELERIVLWAMAPGLGDRCPDAQTLHEALDAYTFSGGQRVSAFHVKKHIRSLFGDLDNSDVLGVGAYSGEAVSSRRFTGNAAESGSTPAPPPIPKPAQKKAPEVSVSVDVDSEPPRRSGRKLAVGVGLTLALLAIAGAGLWFREQQHNQAQRAPVAQAPSDSPSQAPAPGRETNDEANAYVAEAEDALKAGRLQMASALLAKARALSHLSAATQIRLADLADTLEQERHLADARRAMQAEDWKTAKEHAKQALRLNAKNADANKLLATVNDKLKPKAAPAPARRNGNDTGYVTVVTEPPGQVFINDEPRGTAPLQRRSLPAGSHSIEVSLRGYVTVARTVKVIAGRESKVSFRLVPENGEEPKLSTSTRAPVIVASRQTEPSVSDTPITPRAADDTSEKAAAPPPPQPADPPPPKAVTPTTAAVQQAPADEESPLGGCPEGAQAAGAAPPRGNEMYCALPGNVRHGKYIRWFANGRKAETGEYRQGRKNGRWVEYYEAGGERERTEWRRGVKSW